MGLQKSINEQQVLCQNELHIKNKYYLIDKTMGLSPSPVGTQHG